LRQRLRRSRRLQASAADRDYWTTGALWWLNSGESDVQTPIRLRDQRYYAVGQTSITIAGPNSRRKALIISSPKAFDDEQQNQSVVAGAVDTSTTGVKASYTVPAGQQAVLLSATFIETTGTGVVANVQVVRGATTYNLASYTTAGYFGGFALLAGDVVQWNVTTAVAASVSDFTLSVGLDQLSPRVTISFTNPAVIDQGITLNPGTAPLQLSSVEYGDMLQDMVYAISFSGTQTIAVLDIFGP
jgi:hypothetical protein